MDKDPCHELEMARAALAGVRLRIEDLTIDQQTFRSLLQLRDGLVREVEWWQPRCERELRKEEGDE